MPWLLNEDENLKKKMQGIMLSDSVAGEDGRPVPVWFRYPETEIAPRTPEFNYPLIVIEHVALTRNTELEHRGYIPIRYEPDFPDRVPDGEGDLWGDFPIPYNIDYAITTYSRKARQSRELTAILCQFEYLPTRWGFLTIDQDNTIRRQDLLDGPRPLDTIEDGKRIFRQRWVIRVATELLLTDLTRAVPVLKTVLDVHQWTPQS
jgi:hypothetical protein